MSFLYKTKYKIILLPLLFLGSIVCLYSQKDTDSSNSLIKIQEKFERKIKKYTLPNGIRIILMQNNFSPTIACYLKIGVGASNEPFDISGTAHFLEHLLFKGNQKLGTLSYEEEEIYLNQIKRDGERIDSINRQVLDPVLSPSHKIKLEKKKAKLIERKSYFESIVKQYVISEEYASAYSTAGGVAFNAYTSADVTNYQIKLPKNQLELWAYLESQRFIKPQFREFYAERKVILEERRARYDSVPGNLLYEQFLKTAFGFSPYGKPIIGFGNNIPKLSWSETMDFFKKNYIPSRMVITIVGDLNFNTSYNILKKHFEKIPSSKEPKFPPIEMEFTEGQKTANLVKEKAAPKMIMGWYRPNIQYEDNILFSFISSLFTKGKSSRLQKRIISEEKLASAIYSTDSTPGEKLNNIFAIFVHPFSEKDYDKITNIIEEEINLLITEGITEQEITKIKNQLIKQLMNVLQTNAGLADNLSYYELLLNDYRYLFQSINRINSLKKDDVTRILKKYFQKNNNTTVWLNKP